MERKYVSLQVKHESLEKRHNTMSQQYKRLKVGLLYSASSIVKCVCVVCVQADMSSLLCQFSVVGADAAHIRRLEVALRQAQSEKETLLTKLHKLEKQQVPCVRTYVPLFLCVHTCTMCVYSCFSMSL